MRWLATTIIALGTLAGASVSPVLAAAAPGPAAKMAIPDTSQAEKAGRWGRHYHHAFGRGFGGIYIGPGWGFYGGPYYGYGDDYYDDDDYYDYGRTYYYPSYRYRSWGHRHWGGHRHYRHHHRHHRRWR